MLIQWLLTRRVVARIVKKAARRLAQRCPGWQQRHPSFHSESQRCNWGRLDGLFHTLFYSLLQRLARLEAEVLDVEAIDFFEPVPFNDLKLAYVNLLSPLILIHNSTIILFI